MMGRFGYVQIHITDDFDWDGINETQLEYARSMSIRIAQRSH
ncbi:MAG: hypothetical protein ACJZ2B_07070 [Candidatus Neomarinimicrobiota bacterium]|tara:strand:+ start:1150 stop:1275 length:126 start_codon:yes stop_codon:yes gene_type:complete